MIYSALLFLYTRYVRQESLRLHAKERRAVNIFDFEEANDSTFDFAWRFVLLRLLFKARIFKLTKQ